MASKKRDLRPVDLVLPELHTKHDTGNMELNDLRIIICFRKSEIFVFGGRVGRWCLVTFSARATY